MSDPRQRAAPPWPTVGAPQPFVLVRDQDGCRHAIRRTAVIALTENLSGGTTILLSGGRLVVLDEAIEHVVARFT